VAHHDGQQDDGTGLKAWFALSRYVPAIDAFFGSDGKESNGGIELNLDVQPVIQSYVSVATAPTRC
jgi:hypothetical protein